MDLIQSPIFLIMNVFVFFFDSSTVQVQLTDFENAAYVTFVVLLTRVILSFDLNLLIPLSKVTLKGILFVRQLMREGSCPFVGLDNASENLEAISN